MVVGIRQISSATSTNGSCSAPLKTAIGASAMTTMRKIRVNTCSREPSASSFGVFLRCAPSTRPIMRSMKLSPGMVVTSMAMASESTRVPPVTAQRSPPASRMTGADSPVMADSSTLAAPTITSPSAGIGSPAETMTMSPGTRSVAATLVVCAAGFSSAAAALAPLLSLKASEVVREARSDSACALPRPSATASASVAKSTVNHSHTVMEILNSDGCATARTSVNAAPTSTRNITGVAMSWRGFILLSASGRAAFSALGENAEDALEFLLMTGPPSAGQGRGLVGRSGR